MTAWTPASTLRLFPRPAVALATLVAAWLGQASAVSQTTPAQYVDGEVPAAVQQLRRHRIDASLNALTFRNMDQMFDTRVVPRSGPVWKLPRNESRPLPSYRFEGQEYQPAQFMPRTYTNAFLVMRKGTVVYEEYFNNSTAGDHFIVYSVSKSITAMLVGLAVQRGDIRSIDDRASNYVPELRNTVYGDVTLRQLLQMRSGADVREQRGTFEGRKTEGQRVFDEVVVASKSRFADVVLQVGRAAPPGERFNYSTFDTAILGWVLEKATRQPVATFMTTYLWEPMGMESYGYWLADGPPGVGREMNGMGFNATLRDLARLGQMMLDGGRAQGRQILRAEWVWEMTRMIPFETASRSSAARVGYGLQWWQVGNDGAYTALGQQGQYVYVHPDSGTVIVKLSHYPPGSESEAAERETYAFMEAIARSP